MSQFFFRFLICTLSILVAIVFLMELRMNLLISVFVGVVAGGTVEFYHERGSIFNNVTRFHVDVMTPVSASRVGSDRPLRFLFDTSVTETWIELGYFAEKKVHNSREFIPRRDKRVGPLPIEIGQGVVGLESPLVLRHRHECTFRKAAGVLGASPLSVFAQSVQRFTIRYDEERFSMEIGPLSMGGSLGMIVPLVSLVNWDVDIFLTIPNLIDHSPLVGRINTGIRGLILPPLVYDGLAQRIESIGGTLRPQPAFGGSDILGDCPIASVPDVQMTIGGLTVDIRLAQTLCETSGDLITHVLRGDEEHGGVVHLGEDFLQRLVFVHFDLTANLLVLYSR